MMRNTLFALGLFTVATIHPALAQPSETTQQDISPPPIMALQGNWDGWLNPRPDDHGPKYSKQMPDDARDHEGGRSCSFERQHELALSARLSALETRIGIKSNQLDAWRDYTDALQALLAPPRPQQPGDETSDPKANTDAQTNPFARAERMANEVSRQAAAADRLKAAIATLRATLTPEQLALLASADQPGSPQNRGHDEERQGRGRGSDGADLPRPSPEANEQH